ncbi:hypothetical protein BKA69DRAFT_1123971 [Paraphysoderma sedebokerense]|nr:hypothetical protein BKA69DRAFT_1123971 [Paraphysoderma sedebokerense]
MLLRTIRTRKKIQTITVNLPNARCAKYDQICTQATANISGFSECSQEEIEKGSSRTLYLPMEANTCTAIAANAAFYPNASCCDTDNCNAPASKDVPVGAIAGGIAGGVVLIAVGGLVGYRRYKAKSASPV